MIRIYTGKLILLLAAAATLFSCHKEEDFQSMEEGVLPMVFKGEVRSYDDNTKVGGPLSFNNGATLYVRLENGTNIVLGSATYNSEKEAWTFTYSGSIAGWNTVSAKCYYIPNYINSSRTELTLDYNYPIYSDEAASMVVAPGAVTLTAHLTPQTGRLSLGKGLQSGVNRNVKLISGLSYYTGFRLNDYSLTSASDPEISYVATSTNYFHGYFTSKDNPSILLQYGLYQYSRNFGADTQVLKAGHSGYLTVPSSYSHEGWTIENQMDPETDEITVGDVTFKMVTIPGGSFSMGMENVTTPIHEVTLDEFQLGETEVTQGLWEAVMGNNPCSFYGDPNLPVETVSYWDIQVFLFRLNRLMKEAEKDIRFRLPTEAEWEYAARESMGSPLLYSGSDVLADVGWYSENSEETHPVKQKGANGLGLYDMSGNVWEIVSDWGNGSSYPSDPQNNPRGYAWGGGPIRRGGSYNSSANPCRIAAREYWSGYSEGSANMGFRLACGGPQYEPEMVDMGLPSGLKWASFNLGATRPVEIGYYFAWGETEPKSSYNWGNYAFMQNGQSDEWYVNKYTIEDGYTNDGSWYEEGVFVGDGQKVLNLDEDDAARALWGGEWRIPTPKDWEELRDNCDISWSYSSNETNNLSTLIVTSRTNGNRIYLPATGYFYTNGLTNVDSWTYYYHSNTIGYRSSRSSGVDMGNTWLNVGNSTERYRGFNIRPVSGDGNNYSISTSAQDINFGLAATGNTANRTLTITNSGAMPIKLSISCDGDGYSISPSGEYTIPVGKAMDITVSFAPETGTVYEGTVTISSAKLDEDITVSLTGTGNEVESTEYTVNGVKFKMIFISGGTFNMGHNNYANPVHQVTLDGYFLGETEVTQELWEAVMGNNPSNNKGAKLPVESVSWFDAQAFIGKLNQITGGSFHLPTESEWEYAAREAGSDYYIYSGSNTVNEVSWYDGNSDDSTHPVGLKKANALGLYDMSGNVWEWCMDCDYDYPSEAQVNPRGNACGSASPRGGAYTDGDYYSNIYRRHTDGISDRQINHGFRLALGGGSVTQPEMVDLGLPSGLKWASFNLGASRPSDMGYFFAWGETTPKTTYNWSNYKFGGSDEYNITKYSFPDGMTSGVWYDNNVYIGDNRIVLETSDDAATAYWGEDWRMPSPADIQELIDNCSWSWVSKDNISGMEITGPNGNTIFIPSAGYAPDSEHYNINNHFWCLSSSIGNQVYRSASLFGEWTGRLELDNSELRSNGYSIRPVSGVGNNYGMEVSVEELLFYNAPLNEASERVFQVSNTGYLPLTLTIECNNSAFAVSETSFTLGAKQNKDITVTFTPTEASTYTGTLTITPTEFATVSTVSLNGTGINMVSETFTVGGVQFKMVPVPGGTFDMNMDAGIQVTLDDFYIGQTEVTQELWTAVMGSNPSSHTGEANLPVETVSWYNTKVFIERLNDLTGQSFRLPTEAEWEYAARGGSYAAHDTYSGGNDLNYIAWNSNNSADTTHPVKTKSPNYLGIYDMSGNVWEWCEGFYGGLSYGSLNNPRGCAYNENSVNFRGGCFNSIEDCSVTRRGDFYSPENTSNNLGFRLAMGGPTYTPEAIDLGLPSGVKWASFNIGACAPEEIGSFYAWGETRQKDDYQWMSYRFMPTIEPIDTDYITKYSDNDGKTLLDAEEDVATVRWGASWRMPTEEELRELIDQCGWGKVYINGMQCFHGTGPNGNSIYLPFAGLRENQGFYYSPGRLSVYIGKSKYDNRNAFGYYLDDSNSTPLVFAWEKKCGFQVRPVHD